MITCAGANPAHLTRVLTTKNNKDMTICFNNDFERCKFFARCLYKSNGHKDTYSPIFDNIECLFGCGYQVEVKSDVLSVSDVENILKENKVKYNWVNQY